MTYIPPTVTNPPIVATTDQPLAANTKYYPNSANRVVLTLPAVVNPGDQFFVRGWGSGGWKVAQNAGQTIRGAADTTTGTTGFIQSQTASDCLTIECLIANTDFSIINQRGTLTSL